MSYGVNQCSEESGQVAALLITIRGGVRNEQDENLREGFW